MRVSGILTKIRVVVQWLFKTDRHIMLMQCPNCKSINIVKTREETLEVPEGLEELDVHDVYQCGGYCKECGLVVVDKQYWVVK